MWDLFEDRGYRRWIRGELLRNREDLGNQEVLAVSSPSNSFTAYDCLLSIKRRLNLLVLCALFKPSLLTPVSRCCQPCLIWYLNGSDSKIPAASMLATYCRALMGRRSTWGESAGILDSLAACLNPSWHLSTRIANEQLWATS